MSQAIHTVHGMLHSIRPARPANPAYRVPFAIDRSRAPVYRLQNIAAEPVHGLALSLLGDARLLWGLPTSLEPSAGLQFAVHGDDPARRSVLIVRWFRPNGDEYLWRVAF